MERTHRLYQGIKPVVGSAFFAGFFFGLVELFISLLAWKIRPGDTVGAYLYKLLLSQFFLLFFYGLSFAVISVIAAVPFGIYVMGRGSEASRGRVFSLLSAMPSAVLLSPLLLMLLFKRYHFSQFLWKAQFWILAIVVALVWILSRYLVSTRHRRREKSRGMAERIIILCSCLLWIVSILLIYLWDEDINLTYPADKMGPAKNRPNVVLVTVDTLRNDYLGCYGNSGVFTPNIDRLAAQSYRFTQAVTVVPLTLPSHASILTGLYPDKHGVRKNSGRLGEGNRTLAEILRDRGYHTAAFVSVKILGTDYGVEQGFYTFKSIMGGWINFYLLQRRSFLFNLILGRFVDSPDILTRTAGETTDRVMHWIRKEACQPFFLWIHYYDPHLPLTPPEPYAERYRSAIEGETKSYRLLMDDGSVGDMRLDLRLYAAEVTYVDDQLGRLFSFLDEGDMMERTMVVFTSDHGEHLCEHEYYGHALRLYDPSLRIPLIIKPPGEAMEAAVVSRQVESIDIMPTILDMVSAPVPSGIHGRALFEKIRDPEMNDPAFSYGETHHAQDSEAFCYSLRSDKWKFIYWPGTGKTELYDLEHDPQETHDLAGEKIALASAFKSRLESILASQKQEEGIEEDYMDDETRDMLKALGYM